MTTAANAASIASSAPISACAYRESGPEHVDPDAILNPDPRVLAGAAQTARETELANVLHIVARGVAETSAVRHYLNLYNVTTKEQ